MRVLKSSRVFLGLAVFVGLLVVREFGVIDWHYAQSEMTHETTTHWRQVEGFDPPGWGLRIREADPSIHELPLHTHEDYIVKIDAYITKYELTGRYWTPLLKTANVVWETTVLAPDGSQLGTLKGTINLEQVGTSPIHRLRKELRTMVEEMISDTVTEKLRKAG